MANNHALIIFVKNPVLGKVKTRLAKTMGDEKALSIYKQLLAHTKSIVSQLEVNRFLFYSDHIEKDDWEDHLFHKVVQSGDDLGSRMDDAFDYTFKNDNDRVIIIGSDCIDLTSEDLEKAFTVLDEVDVVIGPTEDGGYYLIGMNVHTPELFQNINWSTNQVYQQTLDRIVQNNYSWKALRQLSDIDNESDWMHYLSKKKI